MNKTKNKKHVPQEEAESRRQQAQTIERLARRLPWIVLAVSLFAFVIIFIQALFS